MSKSITEIQPWTWLSGIVKLEFMTFQICFVVYTIKHLLLAHLTFHHRCTHKNLQAHVDTQRTLQHAAMSQNGTNLTQVPKAKTTHDHISTDPSRMMVGGLPSSPSTSEVEVKQRNLRSSTEFDGSSTASPPTHAESFAIGNRIGMRLTH